MAVFPDAFNMVGSLFLSLDAATEKVLTRLCCGIRTVALCLQDDFLLRHYDKGPCKNKLGHTRASVIWHRTQVTVMHA